MIAQILTTFGFSALLAIAIGMALGFFQEKFKLVRDPLVDEVRAALPGANCGGCGYPGCDGYAEAAATGAAPTNRCGAGGASTAAALAALVGGGAEAEDLVSVLRCGGTKAKASPRGNYVGVPGCRAARLCAGSVKACSWGCQGFGDCIAVCKFGALSMSESGLPRVDRAKCTGCGMCVAECPQKLFALVPRERRGPMALCANKSTRKDVIKECKAGCIKCEACVRACPENSIEIVDGMPVTDHSRCTVCGACVDACPTKCYILP
jgi:Na+-translocating ferredoxin:NAD+ oxidoreductase RNF subunit RnfB